MPGGTCPKQETPCFPVKQRDAGAYQWRYRWDLSSNSTPVTARRSFEFRKISTVLSRAGTIRIKVISTKCGQNVGTAVPHFPHQSLEALAPLFGQAVQVSGCGRGIREPTPSSPITVSRSSWSEPVNGQSAQCGMAVDTYPRLQAN